MSKQNKIILIIMVILAAAGLIYLASGVNIPPNAPVRPIDQTDHVVGARGAPAQMIVYSDFECPFCEGFAATMKIVEANFTDKVAIAFRHYPLAIHSQALPAAQASECAAEQGKFWEMHDKLFVDNRAGRMSMAQYKQDAVDMGLDAAKFNQCLDSGKYKDKVLQEMAAGGEAGVTGTPTTFINGQIYPGAYPFEDFTGSDGKQEAGIKTIISELIK